uniref:Uncharacterized protein n=1 Tax=Pseudo-nitzschia australis TaxID=44445 RepID=A0A6U9V4X7_9STRA|mmetsp:Transcript_19948/g.43373  ORF Transcript_19948/g.43373 Transcript_19948/m.43373 type:complete len:399 (-) Transcript_19948:155-1351(-)|eukprot:CAMPEP_0168185018 /NCGR_PEP_ID=MMETSP0139_2-20121125/13591_1 /TAXON_ID=44445 /ORGANISM="Pseudo-nitzschia australis, Strain 10249 10 AB" /LENGTH=398 /DNA_ID=CAMNT_0008106763 /DNA_START=63 /DNA_END=1259 /DNA_ORIENTATION=+
MKFLLNFLTFGLAAATLPIYGNPNKPKKFDALNDVKADSALGLSLLSKARKLEDEEVDFTWVANFSIKFQGCHHISQWNDEADGEEDVRIETKRLIRFRLCPANECSPDKAGGCDSNYGDYVIDMNTFLESYYEALDNYNEYRCEYTSAVLCDCEDGDDKGDDFDEELCEYDCWVEHGMADTCADRNPYEDDEQEQEEEFDLAEYVECKQAEFQNDERRRLDEEEIEYFIGPYCAEQGGAIFMGLFTDETCTSFADEYGGTGVYSSMAGKSLPYSDESLISMDCVSCKEPEDYNNDGNDEQDGDEVIEMCEEIYQGAGKCEQGLESTGYVSSANNNACNYIAGIKVVRKDGIITQVGSKANKTASIFIGVFVVAFVLLAAYVYYLKTKLDRASINLSD